MTDKWSRFEQGTRKEATAPFIRLWNICGSSVISNEEN